MTEEKFSSAYRAFRASAYRNRYKNALLFGGKSVTFGALLVRAEYAFNTFCQMGIEAGEKVALWLPDCPDLLASFYGLSRLGAVAVLIHPESSPREVENQMKAAGAEILLATAGRYERYRRRYGELPQSNLVLCRPELDMKGKERKEYLKNEWPEECEDRAILDQLMAENSYSTHQAPASDGEQPEALLFGTSCFMEAKPIFYSALELDRAAELFWQDLDAVQTVYVENTFATEGGFLAVHSALCAGKTIVWCAPDTLKTMKKKPDFLVATEEFFWALRQQPKAFGNKWKNLQGGYQIGRELTDLMQKFATRVMREIGGSGALQDCPVDLKIANEELFFVGDFGVRIADMEKELSKLPSVAACKVIADGKGLRLRLVPGGKEPIGKIGKSIVACCGREMNPRHLPKSVEFCSSL